jgi:uncharacterized membrane protein
MAFCAQCGAETTGSFCPRCGAAVSGGSSTGFGSTPPPPPGYAQPVATGMSVNVASALCYLVGFITGIIFLVVAPYNQNRTVRFHAFQSIFLSVGAIVLQIGWGIFASLLGAITHGWAFLILSPVSLLIGLGFFVLWLYMMYSAYNDKMVVLPVVGPLAQKQA